eukprot:GHVU01006965.1.p1 GENE.GHVU01006965.1~~GHVU01006965.1.p1  ORF type:complete len:301 (+),score=51.42 GHVU01006965.1:150-1052(+)
MAMDEATLRQVFEGFASEDANRRTEAENAWKATKESNIDQLVDSTVKILLSPDNSQHRQQAAVSIRTILRDAFTSDETEGSEPSSWNKMSAEAKQLLREGLLTGLQKEREKLIRNNICQTVAALALYIMPRKEWPELLPAMGLMMSHDSTQQAVNADGSPKPFAENQAACMQAVALKAAAEMMDLAEWTLLFTTRRDAATQMIVSGLKSCYIEVRSVIQSVSHSVSDEAIREGDRQEVESEGRPEEGTREGGKEGMRDGWSFTRVRACTSLICMLLCLGARACVCLCVCVCVYVCVCVCV